MKRFWIASLACLLTVSGPALAGGPSEAERLFDDGVKKMKTGQFEAACPDIARSHALDPTPGTLFTLAECEAGRLDFPAAMRRYEEYLALYEKLPDAKKAVQDQKQRPQDARAKLAALASKVSELTLELAPGAPAGVRVTRDGTALEPAALGVSARVKPGEHVIGVEAGGSRKELRVMLAAGEKKTVILEVGDKAPERAPPLEPQKRSKVPGVVLGAVGGAAAIAGIGLYAAGRGKGAGVEQDYQAVLRAGRVCTDPPAPGSACEQLHSSASQANTLQRAGVGMLISAGALGVATAVYFLLPQSAGVPGTKAIGIVPGVSAGGGAVVVTGTF